MDVHIDEINSTVRATDGQELLSPLVLRQIVKAVLREIRAELEHERCLESERNPYGNVLTHYKPDGR